MRNLIIHTAILISIAALSACSSDHKQITVSTPENALTSKLGDFTRKSKAKIFDRDNLWKYIDGGAESYSSYGFVKAAIADYVEGQNQMTVQIYSFDKPLGAFGIYAENRSPSDNFINMGAEGVLSPGYLTFYKGEFFVRITSFNQNIDDSILKSIGNIVAAKINALISRPIEFEQFPKASIIDHSERYLPSGFLDSDNLFSVFTAEAQIDTLPATMFLFQDSSGLLKLQTWITSSENAIELSKAPYKSIFKSESAQKIIIANEKNGYCFGVLSLENIPRLDSLFNRFAENIQ